MLFASSVAILPTLFNVENAPATSLISINEANDVINVLLKENIIQGMNDTIIQAQLTDLMPKGLGNRLEIKTYIKSGDAFLLSQSLTVGAALPKNKYAYAGKKFFLVFDNKRISKYGEVNYWVWMP